MTKIALTIAGLNSSDEAVTQADLRTFSIYRDHGARALICMTANNTIGVY